MPLQAKAIPSLSPRGLFLLLAAHLQTKLPTLAVILMMPNQRVIANLPQLPSMGIFPSRAIATHRPAVLPTISRPTASRTKEHKAVNLHRSRAILRHSPTALPVADISLTATKRPMTTLTVADSPSEAHRLSLLHNSSQGMFLPLVTAFQPTGEGQAFGKFCVESTAILAVLFEKSFCNTEAVTVFLYS